MVAEKIAQSNALLPHCTTRGESSRISWYEACIYAPDLTTVISLCPTRSATGPPHAGSDDPKHSPYVGWSDRSCPCRRGSTVTADIWSLGRGDRCRAFFS